MGRAEQQLAYKNIEKRGSCGRRRHSETGSNPIPHTTTLKSEGQFIQRLSTCVFGRLFVVVVADLLEAHAIWLVNKNS